MATGESAIQSLVAQIRHDPNDTLLKDGDRRAARQLAEIGAPAVRPILEAMRGPYPVGTHPTDVVEALGVVLGDIARRDPAPLIEVLEQDAVPPDPEMFFVVAALGRSESEGALVAILSALKHRDRTVRYAAASALVEMKDKRVVEPLIGALSDRSSEVKFTIVEGMKRRSDLRDARALGPLKRIADNRSLRKHSPGLCDYAMEVIRQIEGEMR